MNVWLPKTVKELYTLVDKCARMEEGRRLPEEEDCANVHSEDEDDSTTQKKSKKRSKKWRDKAVMTVEGSGAPSTGKRAKAEAPGKEAATCTVCWEAAAAEKVGGHTARFIGPRATTFKNVTKLISLSKNREHNMRRVTRK